MEQVSSDPSFAMKVALSGIRTRFLVVPQISTDDFFNIWSSSHSLQGRVTASFEADCIVFDVREEAERAVSFIEGSVWIDSTATDESKMEVVKQELLRKITEMNKSIAHENETEKKAKAPRKLVTVAYCSLGYRSSDLIEKIMNSDLSISASSNVILEFYNLEGSLFKWANENKPMVNLDNASTSFVHPYNVVWGKLLKENLRKWST